MAYARESALADMPTPLPDLNAYRALENNGSLIIVGAFLDSNLVGFMACHLAYVPQYGAVVGMTLVFFVDPRYRKKGTGAHMLALVEQKAQQANASGLVIGAPADSRLAKAAPMLGFRETNRLYFKRL